MSSPITPPSLLLKLVRKHNRFAPTPSRLCPRFSLRLWHASLRDVYRGHCLTFLSFCSNYTSLIRPSLRMKKGHCLTQGWCWASSGGCWGAAVLAQAGGPPGGPCSSLPSAWMAMCAHNQTCPLAWWGPGPLPLSAYIWLVCSADFLAEWLRGRWLMEVGAENTCLIFSEYYLSYILDFTVPLKSSQRHPDEAALPSATPERWLSAPTARPASLLLGARAPSSSPRGVHTMVAYRLKNHPPFQNSWNSHSPATEGSVQGCCPWGHTVNWEDRH